MKKIWITSVEHDQERVQPLMSALKPYGLAVEGHFWMDDLPKMAWASPLEALTAKETALWIILAGETGLAALTIRQGLSLLALAVQHRRGLGFPILILDVQGTVDAASLPTPLKGAQILPFTPAALGPKVVALANRPAPAINTDYRINLHPLHGIGLWFEIGASPSGLDWPGALFGVHEAEIDFHGVGPADGVPERTTLEYPMKGMKITLGGDTFTAWGVQNRIDGQTSYYCRVQGTPDRILFGPPAAGDEADVHVINLS